MNIAIVSYSYTENNNIFAECVSKNLSVKHIKIAVQKPVTIKTITLDMIFARTPKVNPDPDILNQYDLILFFGPVWFGQVAFPLRSYLNYLKEHPKQYGFFSISGGSDIENPKLSGELLKRTGLKPAILLDQHIKDLLPLNHSTTRKDTSAYKISESDANRLSEIAIKEITKIIK
ncbi:MAG: hypothetical protein K0S61_3514 [Anaerocolumna sp.]|jgi:hypothetical protein|nr:hypothetical protein [Anaerocolumna sp.]